MHIPDGWLSAPILLVAWGLTLIALGYAIGKIRGDITKLSSIGAVSSIVFIAQMFNFPIAGGTSGHLLGAALSTYLLGIPGAIVAMFSVLLVQAVVFADGGILALGANTLNMGLVGVLVTAGVMKAWKGGTEGKARLLDNFILFLSAFLSVVLASLLAGTELVLSNRTTVATSFPPILGYHVLIGIGEGLLTVFIVLYLQRSGFQIETEESETDATLVTSSKRASIPFVAIGSLLLILSIVALFASPSPDGLSRVGEDLNLPEGSAFSLGIADDYSFLGQTSFIGTLLSALLGAVILLGLFGLPVMYWKERKAQQSNTSS